MLKNLFPNINFSNVIEYLRSAENIVITTHIKPDGDAIGSAMALYYALKDMGKSVNIILNGSDCPIKYNFLPESQNIEQYKKNIHNTILHSADAIILVDLSDLSRVQNMNTPISQSPAKKILIDHHINPDKFDYVCSDENAIATGEIIFALLKEANVKITKSISDALYCAIYTDSGGFRFPKTTPRTHLIATSLLESGTKPNEIYDYIYNQNSLAKIHIHGMSMASMETFLDGQLTFIIITKEMLKQTNCTNEDTEELVQVALSIKETQVAIMIREYVKTNELKISLRSKGDINIQPIAVKFGGGGHINAAGCSLENISIKEAKQILIEEIKKNIFQKNKKNLEN